MNILLITNYFPKPGKKQDAIFLYWRAKELVKAGHSVTILKWNQNLKDYFKKPYNVLDFKDPLFDVDIPVIPIHTVQSKNRLNQNRTYKWIKNNFDIVHFHWLWSMTVFPSIKKWGIPFVVTCHGSDIYRMGESFNEYAIGRYLNKKVMKAQMNRLNNADHVVFVSKDIQREAVKKGANIKSFSVIPNGISDIFNNKSRKQTKKIVIGFAGLLTPIKRADKLIEIFNNVLQIINIDQFLIIGEGILEDQMRKDVLHFKMEDKVKFTGRVPAEKVADYMRTMNVFVLPSRQEAFGCVIKEAQACGAMVVGSSNGGIPEVIGNGGIVVTEGDDFEKRFANAIVSLIKNPIGSNILRECVNNYSWTQTVKQEIDVYQSIIDCQNK